MKVDLDSVMSDPDVQSAQFGIEVEEFLSSPIGRYLLDRATQDIDEARILLDDADPADPNHIRGLQSRIRVAKHFGIWLREAIEDAIAAEQRIKEEDAVADY